MSRPRLLDLFCGAGGAAVGYHRVGFDVVGVDVVDQPHYPFAFVRADALAVDLGGYDAYHASPTCQGYLNLRAVNRARGRQDAHVQQIAAVRTRLRATGRPYVIENVADARPYLEQPVRLCGTALHLPIRRHRLFESNAPLVGLPCAHARYATPQYWTGWRPAGRRVLSTVVQVYGHAGGTHEWPAAMGIDWMTVAEMVEAIPPAYTEYIGRQLLEHLRVSAS